VPDRGGHREESLKNPDKDTLLAVPTVSFQAELAFQGVEDRFDDLTDRFQLFRSASFRFSFQGGSDRIKACSTCNTANVNNSASESFGAIPIFGRHGWSSGRAFNVSSIRA
jgi:hypothetical protein